MSDYPGQHDPNDLPEHLPESVRRQMEKFNALRRSAEQYAEYAKQFDPQQATEMLQRLLKRGTDAAFEDVAEGVGRIGVVFVNVYAVNATGGRWFLVDTGLPGFAGAIKAACEARFNGRPPEGIFLTHAHFDHAGNVEQLAREWGVPIWAHRLEMPYLNGQSDYPPFDPTPGGAICFMSRFFPRHGYNLRHLDLRELPETGDEAGSVPGLNGWRWVHTPGHTPGHVSLIREFDNLLIAGDALATMNLDSWSSMFTRKRELHRPAAPDTIDWPAAKASVSTLAGLEPKILAAGHGLPMSGRYVAGEVQHLAESMHPPVGGRYSGSPVHFDEAGRPTEVPPPRPDPLKPKLTLAATLAVAGLGLALLTTLRRRR